MSRLILEIREYPSEVLIPESELTLDGREEIISDCESMIKRLREVEE